MLESFRDSPPEGGTIPLKQPNQRITRSHATDVKTVILRGIMHTLILSFSLIISMQIGFSLEVRISPCKSGLMT